MNRLECREASGSEELRACYAIRRQVFVYEQRLFEHDDRDEHDARAIHYVAIAHGSIIGAVRMYRDGAGVWWGGRLAVLKGHRGRAGRLLIQACVERARRERAVCFRAFVQLENVAFFKSLKWTAVGQSVMLRNRPHQLMEAAL